MNFARSGFTTGTCAAAAAKAAVRQLAGQGAAERIAVRLPDGEEASLPLLYARATPAGAEAAVLKDAGDDPDVSHGATVIAAAAWNGGTEIVLRAGEGVGVVTKPGLSVPPGQPAINPVPQKMIRAAVREVTSQGVDITLSIPGGKELAEKTFNPRLGVAGGLSILGTTGRVRPFSGEALQSALKCGFDVAAACGVRAPVLVPGHIGETAARKHLRVTAEQVVEVSNEWGFMLDQTAHYPFTHLLILGHPGKLGKLAAGQWDTHSSRSSSAVPIVAELGAQVLGRPLPESNTVEGLFAALEGAEQSRLAGELSARICAAVSQRLNGRLPVAAGLINMRHEWLGSFGALEPWRK